MARANSRGLKQIQLQVALIALFFESTAAIDNGIGYRPPMGWRSWNQFQCNISQSLIETQYMELARQRRRTTPTYTFTGSNLILSRSNQTGDTISVVDLGFISAGIDDCWQKCDSGPGNQGFHDSNGYPIVDTSLFPDMKSMTNKAKSLGIIPGWYGNNCHCRDTVCNELKCFEGDVQATLDFGFESIKLDGCGVEKNVSLFAELFNKSGKAIMIENCHNGNPTYPSAPPKESPFNFFRSSTDIRPTYGSVISNLQSVIPYNSEGLSGPGCWAYPDMLEVGVTAQGQLSFVESRTHFGAWCIVSSPLVLSLDFRDTHMVDATWPIISNEVAIGVNQAYVGSSGMLLAQSNVNVTFHNCSWLKNPVCQHPSWQVWAKTVRLVPTKQVAILLMNHGEQTQDVSIDLKVARLNCPAEGCAVRDVWNHKDLPKANGDFVAKLLPSHDSRFILVQE
eukprot:m.74141 g.74141  ORF g.74141 m.74141 type:complete len:451 (+) comp16151_c0_seq1:146-1498(+)